MVGEVSKTCELFVCTYPLVIQQFAMENDPFIDGLPIKKRLAYISPHLCVGFLFLILYPAAASASSTQLCHTQPCHTHTHHFSTQTFTHNFVTHTTYNFVTNSLSHTTLSHTIFQHKRPVFCVAGAALLALGWIWWRAWSPLVARDAAALCLAGVALGDIHRRFAWQAWQLATSTVPSFPWQAWHLWRWAGSGGALGPRWSPVTPRHFAWQAWHLATSTVVLRGRHGTWRHPPSLCMAGQHLVQSTFVSVAGVALRDIHAASESISLKYDFVTHNKLCHTHSFVAHTTFHTQLCHPQLCHTHTINSFIYNFVTHTQLCHTQSFAHNFVIHNLSHTTLSHTQYCTHNCVTTQSFTHNFVTYNSFTQNSSDTTFKIVDPPPSPLSLWLSPRRFNHFFCLVEEVDMWGCPVLSFLSDQVWPTSYHYL